MPRGRSAEHPPSRRSRRAATAVPRPRDAHPPGDPRREGGRQGRTGSQAHGQEQPEGEPAHHLAGHRAGRRSRPAGRRAVLLCAPPPLLGPPVSGAAAAAEHRPAPPRLSRAASRLPPHPGGSPCKQRRAAKRRTPGPGHAHARPLGAPPTALPRSSDGRRGPCRRHPRSAPPPPLPPLPARPSAGTVRTPRRLPSCAQNFPNASFPDGFGEGWKQFLFLHFFFFFPFRLNFCC